MPATTRNFLMALILSLETSTDVCSVAIHNEGTLLHEKIIREPQAHAAKLAPLIQETLRDTNIQISQLSAVAITSGPGSYTGLRIGTSTAKGICYAANVPLIAIPTLEVLAFQARQQADSNDLLCPMIDARRMEVYCQVFDRHLNAISRVDARVIDGTSFAELFAVHNVLFFGNGSEKCRPVLISERARFIENIVPLASALGVIAAQKLKNGSLENLENFIPFYLKDFVAKKAQPLLG
jgi:tRNA threonylcarbamoyladenosine biosynthesis protein TsaB